MKGLKSPGIDESPLKEAVQNDRYVHHVIKMNVRERRRFIQGFVLDSPDIIIHSAGTVGMSRIKENPNYAIYNNVTITSILLEAIAAAKKKDASYNPMLLYFSSAEVYGNTSCASVRTNTYNLYPETARGAVAISKLLEENVLNNFKREHGLGKLIIMRLFNVVGETQDTRFVVGKLVKDSIMGQPKVACTYRNFCHISFLTSTVSKIIEQWQTDTFTTFPNICNFGSFNPENYISIVELARIISSIYPYSKDFELLKVTEHDIVFRKNTEYTNIPPNFLDREKDIPIKEIVHRYVRSFMQKHYKE